MKTNSIGSRSTPFRSRNDRPGSCFSKGAYRATSPSQLYMFRYDNLRLGAGILSVYSSRDSSLNYSLGGPHTTGPVPPLPHPCALKMAWLLCVYLWCEVSHPSQASHTTLPTWTLYREPLSFFWRQRSLLLLLRL